VTRKAHLPSGRRKVVGSATSVKSGSASTTPRSAASRSSLTFCACDDAPAAASVGGCATGRICPDEGKPATVANAITIIRTPTEPLPPARIHRAAAILGADTNDTPERLRIRQQVVVIAAALLLGERQRFSRLAGIQNGDVVRLAVGVQQMRIGLNLMRARVVIDEAHLLPHCNGDIVRRDAIRGDVNGRADGGLLIRWGRG